MKSVLTYIGTDYPVILFFLLLLWRARTARAEPKALVPVEEGESLRGIAALMVLLHHMAPMTRHGFLMPRLYSIGTGGLAVGIFFFLSGYGVMKQYMKKGDAYRRGFLRKRLPTILIPWAVAAVLYWLTYRVIGKVYTFANLIDDLKNGIPFVAYSWYLMALTFFYLFFWVLIHVCRNRVRWMPLAGCLWYVLYALICIKLKYLIFWYDTAHLIPVGMFCAVYEEKILKALKNRAVYVAVVLTSLICWLLCTNIYSFGFPVGIHLFYIVSLIRLFSFVVMVMVLRLKIKADNPVLRFFGSISMETYLFHGLIYYLLRGDYCHLESDPLFCFLGLGITILAACILAPLDRFLLRSWKRLVK